MIFSSNGEPVNKRRTGSHLPLSPFPDDMQIDHPQRVTSAVFSLTNSFVLVGCEDGVSRLWDIETVQIRSECQHGIEMLKENLMFLKGKGLLWIKRGKSRFGLQRRACGPLYASLILLSTRVPFSPPTAGL